MREEAIVEVYGHLVSDIVIGKLTDGRQYGKIIISVSKIRSMHSTELLGVYQDIWLPVFIWNQELLEKESSLLTKGLRVLIIGELELFERSSDFMRDKMYSYLQDKTIVISLNRNRAISIIR